MNKYNNISFKYMYRIKTDIEKNRLTITFAGFVSGKEAVIIKMKMLSEISNLSPGFSIINDISHFGFGGEDAGRILKDTIKHLIEHKVDRIIRVVGASESALCQFANYTEKNELYRVYYVPTLEEAESLLDEEKNSACRPEVKKV